MTTTNRAQQTGASARSIISHAHARDLALCWQDEEREQHPVTRLAATGQITADTEASLAHDLRLLETAAATWGTPPSIPEKQVRALLDYVRHHGERAPVDGWAELRDTEFLRAVRRMASEARRNAPPDEADDGSVHEISQARERHPR